MLYNSIISFILPIAFRIIRVGPASENTWLYKKFLTYNDTNEIVLYTYRHFKYLMSTTPNISGQAKMKKTYL